MINVLDLLTIHFFVAKLPRRPLNRTKSTLYSAESFACDKHRYG